MERHPGWRDEDHSETEWRLVSIRQSGEYAGLLGN